MTKKVSMATAKASLSEIASRASAGERFVLLRRGRPVAGIVGPADLEILENVGRAASFLDALRRFRRRYARELPEQVIEIRRSAGRRVR